MTPPEMAPAMVMEHADCSPASRKKGGLLQRAWAPKLADVTNPAGACRPVDAPGATGAVSPLSARSLPMEHAGDWPPPRKASGLAALTAKLTDWRWVKPWAKARPVEPAAMQDRIVYVPQPEPRPAGPPASLVKPAESPIRQASWVAPQPAAKPLVPRPADKKPPTAPPPADARKTPAEPYVTRGVVTIEPPPPAPPPAGPLPAPGLVRALKQRIEGLCGNSAGVVDVQFASSRKVVITIQPRDASKVSDLTARIMALPELQTYETEIHTPAQP
jgi:hypothetical protein